MNSRERELEAIVRRLMPALQDIAWCQLVWNDHNFTTEDLLRHAKRAGEAMGFKRPEGVDAFNDFWLYVDRVLDGSPAPQGR